MNFFLYVMNCYFSFGSIGYINLLQDLIIEVINGIFHVSIP
jgi:hypothetical protein